MSQEKNKFKTSFSLGILSNILCDGQELENGGRIFVK